MADARTRRIEASLEANVHHVLPLTLSILAVMFVFFVLSAPYAMPAEIIPTMRMLNSADVVMLIGLRVALPRMRRSSDAAHGVLLVATLICISSAGTHLYIGNEPLLSNWFLLVIVGLSQLAFSPRWFIGQLVLVVASWFGLVVAVGWSDAFGLYAVAVVSFAAASALMFYVRRQTLYRLEEARIAAEEQRSELTASNEALEQARQSADIANATKSRFLANMSHELRTPLNAIIGYAEMLQEVAEEDGLEDYVSDLEKVGGAATHLLGLISNILDLSKIESGALELAIESIDVAELVQEVVATVTPLVEKNDNRLEIDVSPELGSFESDAMRVRQILLNLLANAAKFTTEGTVRLAVALVSRDGDDYVELAVEDTGIGMTAEQIEKIFDSFRQADATTARDYGGTGLGLAISKHLCERLGGSISVESEMGRGSTFRACIPMAAELSR
jgi:signal transduction histidine kinase